MLDFFKKSTKEEKDERFETSKTIASGYATTESARVSTEQAAVKFSKPDKYDRNLYDDGTAKNRAKQNAFKNNKSVKDPYTGKELELTKKQAKAKYGDKWQEHMAEADHTTPLERVHEQTKRNPWLTNDDIKKTANNEKNIDVTSRKYNNAKRSRTNKEYATDDKYLKEKGVKLKKGGKEKAIQRGEESEKFLKKEFNKQAAKNIVHTGHQAGSRAATDASVTAATMSGINNIVMVINGEKDIKAAIKDTAVDTGKAAVTGYVMGGGLTTVCHTLSYSSSKFVQALAKSNVPGTVITAAMATGNTLKRYAQGEITTQECIIELGEKGLNMATTGYSMAVGQTLIPIPVVGAAVGALVGSALTSKYYSELINELQTKQLEHEERMRIIAECEKVAEASRNYRKELEEYIESYFLEYQDCFDEALSEISLSFCSGDANGVIVGANKITNKLGGKVYYETVDEFKCFLKSDVIDEF